MTANTVTLVKALSSSSKAQPSFPWFHFAVLCFPVGLSVLLCCDIDCYDSLSFAVLCYCFASALHPFSLDFAFALFCECLVLLCFSYLFITINMVLDTITIVTIIVIINTTIMIVLLCSALHL